MQRRFRVWRLLPPRNAFGADSTSRTEAPSFRAVIAAQSAAFPPPRTRTSYARARSGIPRPLFGLDVRLLHDVAPALLLLLDEGGELRRRGADRDRVVGREALADGFRFGRLRRLRVQALDDGLRGLRGRDQTIPLRRLESLVALLRN